jgi:hypothetical protein
MVRDDGGGPSPDAVLVGWLLLSAWPVHPPAVIAFLSSFAWFIHIAGHVVRPHQPFGESSVWWFILHMPMIIVLRRALSGECLLVPPPASYWRSVALL